jgi:glycerophosphoryl diester phosphodiesterase
MKKSFGLRVFAIVALIVVAAVYITNASWIWASSGRPVILAHRGLAQDFSRENLGPQTCTATRMLPPVHGFLENTSASIEAALGFGANVVEIDVHPTTDGEFAVFHDWTLDCRTDGHGVTRTHSMSYLRTLDIGYGYTADGGRTHPFRGHFVGAMPTLAEVAAAFPDSRFLVNLKSNDASEGDRLADYIIARRIPPRQLMSYGGDKPIGRLRSRLPAMRLLERDGLQSC